MPTAAITAIGAYLPEYVLTNQELEKMVDTTDAWIVERTGIKERRILKEGATSDMGAKAVTNLCERRGIDPQEIDLIICATVTPDMMFPATAGIIAYKAGARRSWSYDVEAACGGFLFSLITASQFIETGRHKKVVVVGADKMSSIVDYEDRNTCIIFGDAAAAVLLEPNEEGLGLLDYSNHVDGSGVPFLHMKAGGSAKPPSFETVAAKEHYIFQEGKTVFKAAVVGMAEATVTVMEKNGLTGETVDYLVPHQANQRIIEATRQRMNLDPSRVMINIDRYGNTTGATIPLCLHDWESQLKIGQNLILAAFGGGFTWGAAYLKWAYEQ